MATFINGILCYDMADVTAGVAPPFGLGTPVPKEQPPTNVSPITPTTILDEVPARRLKKDVLTAYEALGGTEYLIKMGEKDPNNFNKLLTKILPQAIEADVRMELKAKDLSLLSTTELKAMFLQAIAHPGRVLEGELVEPAAENDTEQS